MDKSLTELRCLSRRMTYHPPADELKAGSDARKMGDNEELYVQTVLFVIFTGSPNPAIVPRVSIRAFTKNFDHRLWASDDHWCSKVHHRPKTLSSTLVLVVQIGSLLTNYPLLRISNKSLVPLQLRLPKVIEDHSARVQTVLFTSIPVYEPIIWLLQKTFHLLLRFIMQVGSGERLSLFCYGNLQLFRFPRNWLLLGWNGS